MSAFICSDSHIATIAANYGQMVGMPKSEIQKLADQLKSWNVGSVNYKYNEHTPATPCRLDDVVKLKPIDMVQLCDCLEYQSCERPDWRIDCDKAYDRLAAIKAQFQAQAACSAKPLRRSTVWSI